MSTLPFIPSRGCLGCPHRGTCHTARQQLQDPLIESGRHYGCPYYADIQDTIRRKDRGTFFDWVRVRSALDAALKAMRR